MKSLSGKQAKVLLVIMNEIVILKKNLAHRGGLENQTFQIAQAFQKKGFNVTFLTSGKIDPHFQNSALQFHSFFLKSWMNFLKVGEFDRLCQKHLKNHPAKIIFGMERNCFQTHLRLGNGIHRAYLTHLSQFETPAQRFAHFFNPGHRTFLKLEKAALEHPDLRIIIANSAMVKEEILHYYKVDPSKIHVLHNGVDWKGMQTDFERQPDFARFGLDSSKFQFLFVGHNYKRKGLDLLLKALSKLKDYQLSVVGQDRNIGFYKQLAKSLKMDQNIFFFGPQANVRPFYQIADCLVIPSIYDPFSNATLEALGMGVYVVSSKTNGGHEVLSKFSGSTIADLRSLDSFVESLQLAQKQKKTAGSAQRIRDSIKHLDFSIQLEELIRICV
ncbi:MAG TPA: glycosyltransferase family 4 protein [Rhabdochlamydiaceae bacterium]|nr:glycosyltransferase family 4 protein [Rhabdochlamydiaceae bacterium]